MMHPPPCNTALHVEEPVRPLFAVIQQCGLLKEFSADDLCEEVLLEDPVVIVAASDHPLAHQKKIDWHELNGLPWILPSEGAPMRQRLETMLAAHGVATPTIKEIGHSKSLSEEWIASFVSCLSPCYTQVSRISALD